MLARQPDQDFDVFTLLAAQDPIPRKLAGELAEAVRAQMGQGVVVAVISAQAAWTEEAGKPVGLPLIVEVPKDKSGLQ